MILFASFFTVLLAQTDCANWCDKHSGEWESKCAFNGCSGCTECSDVSACPDWCKAGYFETMCAFTKCKVCGECDTQPLCASWCVAKDNIEWSMKCQWQNCEGCSQCVTTTEEVVAEGCTLAIREQSSADLQAAGCFCDTFSGGIMDGAHQVEGAWKYDGVLPCKVCQEPFGLCAECHAGTTNVNGNCVLDNNPCQPYYDNPCTSSGLTCLVDDYVDGAWTYSCIVGGEGLDD